MGTQTLSRSGIVSPRHEARILLEKVSNMSRLQMITNPDQTLPSDVKETFMRLLKARGQDRMPVSRLVGEREFWSLSFQLSSATLDPRPDSETLIEGILSHVLEAKPLKVLDLGTGSGCLLITLLTEFKVSWGVGIDLSREALLTAQLNAKNLGVSERSHFIQMDWARGLQETFNVIVSNPPYIPENEVPTLSPEVRLYDPYQALTAGPEGLESYRYIAPEMKRLLVPGGLCAIEIGKGQQEPVEDLFIKAGLTLLEWRSDLAGISRCGFFVNR
tara:strand:- start:339 stop:1160 length:822 start_codon:yes stop_codon:yes gene_type:complete